jgi:hypothetical protein
MPLFNRTGNTNSEVYGILEKKKLLKFLAHLDFSNLLLEDDYLKANII